MSGESTPTVALTEVRYQYGNKVALDGVTFSVDRGAIFGLLGPNGGGKTTLFRILSTLLRPASGTVEVLGMELPTRTAEVRRRLGIVFQSPSLDGKLTVRENLHHHGLLYGLRGRELNDRIDEGLERLGVVDRQSDYVETLSGGLARRVELAKGLLSSPELLILDEPSTGLDPGARRDLWTYLEKLRASQGTSILVTTHLIEEAERCDRLAILDRGRVIAQGSPDELRRRIGGEVILVHCQDPERVGREIRERFGQTPVIMDGTIRLEVEDGHRLVQKLYEHLADDVEQISLGRPTLEDVFVRETGHRFWEAQP